MKGLGSIRNSTSPFLHVTALLVRNSLEISRFARPDLRILNSVDRANPLANQGNILLDNVGNQNLGRATSRRFCGRFLTRSESSQNE